MRTIDKIIVHHSASSWGDRRIINRWHVDRGFDEIGYHFILLNGKRTAASTRVDAAVGFLEIGRSLEKQGAHTRGENAHSIGICLIGTGPYFHILQIAALVRLCRELMEAHSLRTKDVYVHLDFAQTQCPGFGSDTLRTLIGDNDEAGKEVVPE